MTAVVKPAKIPWSTTPEKKIESDRGRVNPIGRYRERGTERQEETTTLRKQMLWKVNRIKKQAGDKGRQSLKSRMLLYLNKYKFAFCLHATFKTWAPQK